VQINFQQFQHPEQPISLKPSADVIPMPSASEVSDQRRFKR
jgi:hypothetical protein